MLNLEPIPGRRWEYTLDGGCQSITTHINTFTPVGNSPTAMFLGGTRNLENPEEINNDKGRVLHSQSCKYQTLDKITALFIMNSVSIFASKETAALSTWFVLVH